MLGVLILLFGLAYALLYSAFTGRPLRELVAGAFNAGKTP